MELTETKFKKLRKWTLCMCSLALISYAVLIRYAMKVNPGAFIYNPMTDAVPIFAQIQSTLWWIVCIGWLFIVILFMR